MSLANLQFSRLFINVIQPLYICKLNLQAAMEKEDCELIAGLHNSAKVWVAHT